MHYGRSPLGDFFRGDLPSRVIANKICVNMGYPISDVSMIRRAVSGKGILNLFDSVSRGRPRMIPLNLQKCLILVFYRVQYRHDNVSKLNTYTLYAMYHMSKATDFYLPTRDCKYNVSGVQVVFVYAPTSIIVC